jgi:hypothetical protein
MKDKVISLWALRALRGLKNKAEMNASCFGQLQGIDPELSPTGGLASQVG